MSNPPNWVVSWLSYGVPLLSVASVPIMWGLTEKMMDLWDGVTLTYGPLKTVYIAESVLLILFLLVYTYF